MNWVIIQGLRGSSNHTLADELAERTLDLIRARGFFEYFSAIRGTGFGAEEFSWTAALALELLDSAQVAPRQA